MTHKDIYTKFMIEYDKAQITSSYPSLTKYEIATILDKAYLAVIGQKLTGNNPRQASFEADIKAIEDIRPLLTTSTTTNGLQVGNGVYNEKTYNLPSNLLYFIQATIQLDSKRSTVTLISHEDATKFFQTDYNKPWIKGCMAFIEDSNIVVLYDPDITSVDDLRVTYIKKPIKFTQDDDVSKSVVKFELNDTVAEEVINQAIIFAAEDVESPRLTTKVQTKSFEA